MSSTGEGAGEPRRVPAALAVAPADEAVAMRVAEPSQVPPPRQRLRSRGIRGHFVSFRTDSDEEDPVGHIESFSHASESDEINGISIADDPALVSSNFDEDGSDEGQRQDLDPDLMEIVCAGVESENGGDEASPEAPPGMALAAALEEACTEGTSAPRFVGGDYFQGLGRRNAAVDPALTQHVAQHLQSDAMIQEERNKAREEAALAARPGK
jgi:hypothetical protein